MCISSRLLSGTGAAPRHCGDRVSSEPGEQCPCGFDPDGHQGKKLLCKQLELPEASGVCLTSLNPGSKYLIYQWK